MFVFLDPRPTALGLHLLGPLSPKYCNSKFMNKAYYLYKIILFKSKTLYLFKLLKKLFRRPSYVVQNKWKGFFFINIKRNRKKTLCWNTFNKFTISQLFLGNLFIMVYKKTLPMIFQRKTVRCVRVFFSKCSCKWDGDFWKWQGFRTSALSFQLRTWISCFTFWGAVYIIIYIS